MVFKKNNKYLDNLESNKNNRRKVGKEERGFQGHKRSEVASAVSGDFWQQQQEKFLNQNIIHYSKQFYTKAI